MQNKTEILRPESTYHIYKSANGSERVFRSEENYRFFLERYEEYISPVADTFCYCLMPNHFHFLARIKPCSDLQGFLNLEGLRANKKNNTIESYISQQFSNFFNAYVKSFNKAYNRKGSLLMHPYKRKLVTDEHYFKKLVHYIHQNPVEAGLCDHPGKYRFSSYTALTKNDDTFLAKAELIRWFGGLENFVYVILRVNWVSLLPYYDETHPMFQKPSLSSIAG